MLVIRDHTLRTTSINPLSLPKNQFHCGVAVGGGGGVSEPALCLRSMRIRTLLHTCTSRKRCFSDTGAVRAAGCRGFSSCSTDLRQWRPSLHLYKILRSQSAVSKRQFGPVTFLPSTFYCSKNNIPSSARSPSVQPCPLPDFVYNLHLLLCIPPNTRISSSNAIHQFLHGAFTACHSVSLTLCPTSAPPGCCFLRTSDSNVTFAARFPLPAYLPPTPAPHYHAYLS